MGDSSFTVQRDGHVLLMGFNRPEKRNDRHELLVLDLVNFGLVNSGLINFGLTILNYP